MITLRDLVIWSMKEYGYRLENYEPSKYLFFTRDSDLMIVGIFDEKVNGEKVLEFKRDLEQYKGSKHIISLEGYTDDAINIAKSLNIYLITRDELERDIGEYILTLLIKDQQKLKEILEMDVEVEEELEKIETDSETIPIFLEEKGLTKRIISPAVWREQAIEIAKKDVQGFQTELILVPYYIYEYKLDLIIEGVPVPKRVFGRLGFNAQTGEIRYITTGLNIVQDLDIEYTVQNERISKKEAENIVKNELYGKYTKEEEIITDKENVTIIEKRKTRPKDGTINVSMLGVYYWPYWVVSGNRGKVIIDGVDKNVVQKRFNL